VKTHIWDPNFLLATALALFAFAVIQRWSGGGGDPAAPCWPQWSATFVLMSPLLARASESALSPPVGAGRDEMVVLRFSQGI
jgi:hypothetical protein